MGSETKAPAAPFSSEIEAEARAIMSRPYRKVISGDADDGFLIEVPELPGCMTAGETEAEAVELLHDAMLLWIGSALEEGKPIPEQAADHD